MAATTFPGVATEVSAAWLAEVLARPVAAVHATPIGVGVGIMGSLARVEATFTDGASASYVVKCSSLNPDTVAVAVHYGFYRAEVSVYRELGAAGLGVRIPHCHHAEVTDDGAACILVLEDLGAATAVDQIAGCPPERVPAVLDALAGLHARWWRSPRVAELGWLRRVDDPAYKSNQAHYAAVYPAFRAGPFAAGIDERWLDLAERYGAQIGAMIDHFVEAIPLTIAHYDTRLDNVFFDLPDGNPVALLDWQICANGPGVVDVAYFLAQSVRSEDRRAHETAWLRRYHAGLERNGVTDYAFERLWDDYRLAVAAGLSISVVASSIDPGNDRGRELLATMVRRSFAALADLDPADVLRG
jgi:hypothetical protein